MFDWLRRRLRPSPSRTRAPVAVASPEAEATLHFSAELAEHLGRHDTNWVVGVTSPYDLLARLAPLAAGETAAQLFHVLGGDHLDATAARRARHEADVDATLRAASALFTPRGAPPLEPPASLDLYTLPAESPEERVNAWIAEATGGLIPRLVDEEDITSVTKLLAVDAIYFKAAWQHTFTPEATRALPFHTPNAIHPVPTMELEAPLFATDDDEPLLVSLAYAGERFALDIVVGDAHDVATWRTRRAKASRQNLRLRLPRFSIAPGPLDLAPVLASMGAPALFDPTHAELPGLGPPPLGIERLAHSARIDVTEAGTEAAAATVGIAMQSRDPTARPIHIDRPFSFFLHDTVDPTLLFVGRVANPSRS